MRVPGLREAFFTPPDARGNAPHATREQADAEGRRLNAKRYETVGQAERALDRRAAVPLGEVQPQPQSSGLGWLLGIGLVGLGLAWLSSQKNNDDMDSDGDDDQDDDDGEAPQAPPATQPVTLNLTVSSTAGEPKVTTTPTLLPNPAPEAPKRRRRKKAPEAPAAPTTPTTPEV
jgi:hypothetical protein